MAWDANAGHHAQTRFQESRSFLMDDVRFWRAMKLRDKGKEEDALRELEELASLTPDADEKASLVLNQSTCLARLGRVEEARQRWREATRSLTGPYEDFLDACLCVSERKTEEAVHKLTAFLQNHSDMQSIDPELYSEAEERLGLLLYEMNRFADAVALLERAIKLRKGDADRRRLCYYIGSSHFESGNFRAAEPRFAESLLLDRREPLWAQAQFYLGCIYFKKRAYIDAGKAFELCEAFVDDADHEMKEGVSSWLAAARRQLGERGGSRTQ